MRAGRVHKSASKDDLLNKDQSNDDTNNTSANSVSIYFVVFLKFGSLIIYLFEVKLFAIFLTWGVS